MGDQFGPFLGLFGIFGLWAHVGPFPPLVWVGFARFWIPPKNNRLPMLDLPTPRQKGLAWALHVPSTGRPRLGVRA